MGSKNLKAIVVRGSLPIHIADPEGFITAVDKSRKKLLSTDTLERLRTHGTCGSLARANASCTIPVRNFQDDHIDKKETDGLELEWGDYRTVIQLIEKMAYGVGFGGILKRDLIHYMLISV